MTLWEHLELAAAAFQMEREAYSGRAEQLLRQFRLWEVRHPCS
ncbi:hypothetical protein [Ferviditalea candida]|uniref:Uncharacterized protein n=1 Tax=Ferviditalea candida TaxID=3108399 RepID=A0ABU5ZIZ9_9BACL|nr:hypothetical protein [Paenibacillaceae bacterium T2]